MSGWSYKYTVRDSIVTVTEKSTMTGIGWLPVDEWEPEVYTIEGLLKEDDNDESSGESLDLFGTNTESNPVSIKDIDFLKK